MRRCEVCGSPFHGTRSYRGWVVEWFSALAAVMAVIGLVVLVAWLVLG